MNEEEIKNLADRFEKGETTKEEDLEIATTINASLELAKFFLNEIKIVKIKQDIIK
ncbi:MAG: hypothetical protein NT068_03380 [Candidatus Nomurabacteria bacterium]|nr:hypothetical protein [Candidatus Nomurabacteria bacterium]